MGEAKGISCEEACVPEESLFMPSGECKNAAEVLLCIFKAALSLFPQSLVCILFPDPAGISISLAVFMSQRGIEARRISFPISGTALFPAVFADYSADCAPQALLLDNADSLPLKNALFPDCDFPDASMLVSPMRLGGKCIALLAALYSPPECPCADEASLSRLSVLAAKATEAYLRAADFQALQGGNYSLSASVKPNDPEIAESRIIKEKLAVVRAIADSPSPVLFIGESGTGREFFARKLHSLSRRASEPFVRVNCPAFSDALLQQILFGGNQEDSRTAESGGSAEHSGLLEKAGGGTVFLRGIESLSPAMQERLVRVLQTGCIEKEGAAEPARIAARIAASTDRDLEKLAAEKKFRADLYYSIGVIPLYLPPLIARREDILPLARAFLGRHSAQSGKPFLFFSAAAEEALLTYPWPGNVRELESTLACACATGSPPCITKDDLLLKNNMIPDNNTGADKTLKSALTFFKKQYAARILAENSWNQTASAKVLGIQRTYLSRLIKELKIRER